MAQLPATLIKHKLVIDEWFVNGFSGPKAYQKYYNVGENVASSKFFELVRNGDAAEYKRKKHEEAHEILGTSHVEVLNELKNWLYADIRQTIGLSVQEIKDLPVEIGRLITEFEHSSVTFNGKTTNKIKLKFVSKEKALEVIAKHIDFFNGHNKSKATIVNIPLTSWVDGLVDGVTDMDKFDPNKPDSE